MYKMGTSRGFLYVSSMFAFRCSCTLCLSSAVSAHILMQGRQLHSNKSLMIVGKGYFNSVKDGRANMNLKNKYGLFV